MSPLGACARIAVCFGRARSARLSRHHFGVDLRATAKCGALRGAFFRGGSPSSLDECRTETLLVARRLSAREAARRGGGCLHSETGRRALLRRCGRGCRTRPRRSALQLKRRCGRARAQGACSSRPFPDRSASRSSRAGKCVVSLAHRQLQRQKLRHYHVRRVCTSYPPDSTSLPGVLRVAASWGRAP